MIKGSVKYLVALGLVVMLSFMVACGGTEDVTEDAAEDNSSPSEVEKPESSDASNKEGLPASFTAYGNSYTISDFEVTEEEGVTVISCSAAGFDVIPFRNGGAVVPVGCSLLVDGRSVSYVSASLGGENPKYYFDDIFEPELVVFYPSDNESEKIEITVD